MIEDATGRSNNDVCTVGETRELRPYRRTPAEREHLDVVFGARQAPQFVGNLIGELSSRT